MTEHLDSKTTVRSMRRRQFLRVGGLAGAAGAAGVLAANVPALAAEDGEEGLAGAWLETLTSTDGSFAPFQVLFTYTAGGGLIGTASIDALPGLKSSPTHGAWKSAGEHNYVWTGHAFSFDDAGTPNGYYNITERIKLRAGGDGYDGSGTFEVVNGPGAFPLTGYTVSAVRITT